MKAYNIQWDTDGDLDVFLSLPNEIKRSGCKSLEIFIGEYLCWINY